MGSSACLLIHHGTDLETDTQNVACTIVQYQFLSYACFKVPLLKSGKVQCLDVPEFVLQYMGEFWMVILHDLRSTISFLDKTCAYIMVQILQSFYYTPRYVCTYNVCFIRNIKTDQFNCHLASCVLVSGTEISSSCFDIIPEILHNRKRSSE